MIKRFHSLYVGQIELENIGLAGTPADDRRYGNDRFAEVFWTAKDVAQEMDALGYYALWTAEHHFQREGYECFPNLIQLSLWLATQTKRLKLGCAFNVLPMWHPIRLAEDYAMADIVTDGRVIMGVGRGYHSREVESFGAPVIDQAANRELFEEQVDLMLKCFNAEAFSHHGKAYDVPPAVEYRGYQLTDITCVPRPKHLPVEIWMPIASSKSIDYMASKKFKAMITLNGEKILDDVVKAVRLRPLRRRARAHVGHAGRPRAGAEPHRRYRAEGVVLRAARARDRGHQVDRGEVSGARGLHDPLGRGPAAQGVQGAAALVRARGHARLSRLSARGRYTGRGYFRPRGEPPTCRVFCFVPLVRVVVIPLAL